MDTRKQLHAKAQRIRVLAEAELNESVRNSLLEIAALYDQMADKVTFLRSRRVPH